MRAIFKLLRFLRPYWRDSMLALLSLILVVALDLSIPRMVQRLIDHGILPGDLREIQRAFFMMLILSALDAAFALMNNAFSVRVSEGVARDLREALFLRIHSLPLPALDQWSTGGLMVRLSSDAAAVQRLVQITLRIGTRAPLLIAGSILLMFQTDARLTQAALPLLLLTSGLIGFFLWRMEPLFATVQERLDRLNIILQENIAGVRTVRAFHRGDDERRRFEQASAAFTERNIRVMEQMALMGPSLSLCLNLGIVLVVWMGGWQAAHGGTTPGRIAAFVNYLQTTLNPLLILANLAQVWASASASAVRIHEILDQSTEAEEPEEAVDRLPALRPRVALEDVSFRYEGSAGAPVLHRIHLTLEPGQIVAILGPSGAGKSTLLHLLLRFYDPTEGRITLDGLDLRRLRRERFLARVAWVPQEPSLFSGTVRDNIRFGRPDAPDEEVIEAAMAAQAHEFIIRLPEGYDTWIGERGVTLSGGQRQRIAIARALLMRPDLLLLDDATSAVDLETESRILRSIREWMREGLCIIVTQRLSTARRADRMVVMEGGRVLGIGTHAELLGSCSLYREIYAAQIDEEILEVAG